MRLNKDTIINGKNVVLVSYKKEHVLKYHTWMADPELQLLTASEPLSLEEEYQMQKSWLNDLDKCTFIILEKTIYDGTGDEIAAMIGDTNLFFIDPDNKKLAECEIMIAEPTARGKRRGMEAMCLMFYYGIEMLGVETFQAKIGLANEKSIKMFTKLGFTEVGRSEIFKEVTMLRLVDTKWKKWLYEQIPFCKMNIK
ncbi:N-acetyltransferase 9-like protein [Chrysoperla carnea]|uniref:N-acetyltransferase 9-like protein n=1 Tax=Chrysoperla carnea TaxID=189513 RepID=UPI001D0823D2|nr:N-acetyltransferase 9-like protein [Chrysoperla carnea]